ncbi:DUF2577 domain-containing protein [Intestinibacillus massiliensis]|nr:DUF2577 domain-containing protein [Intestinibacillus massiliensis]
MSEQLLTLIKQAAVEAVQAAAPMEITFGTVQSVSPLKIKIGSKHTIDEDFLIKTEASVDKLAKGDKAVLLRMQGGQRFLFIDKVVD